MTEAEFVERRRHGIGASDAGIICGYGFIDPETLFRQKLGLEQNLADARMGMGTTLQPVVTQMYEERFGVRLKEWPAFVRSTPHPWQFANVDRVTENEERIVELKCVFGYFGDEWGEEMTEEAPENYVLQVTQQMGVTGFEVADIAALSLSSCELRVYRVAFNQDLYDTLTGIEAAFWDKVRRRDFAFWDAERAAAIREMLDSVKASRHKDFGVRAEEVNSLVLAWELAKQSRKEWEKQEEHFKDVLLKELGDCGSALLPDGRLLKQSVSEVAETTRVTKAHVRHNLSVTKGRL